MSGKAPKRFGILKAIVVVVVLLVAVILALPFLLNVNKFRPNLESKLTSALGRDVKMGNLKLSILAGSVGVDDIIVADNPDFSQSPFVTAKSLKASVELKPLILSKEVHITGIYLDHPAITLIRSSSGKWNFSDLGGSGGASNEDSAESTHSISGTNALIKEIKITGGRVTIIEGHKKPSVYDDVNVTVNNLSFATSFPFTITAGLPGSGQFKLDGQAGPLNKGDLLATPMSAALAVNHFDLINSGFAEPDSGLSGLFDFGGTAVSDGKQVRSKGYANADKLKIVKGGSPAGKPIRLEYVLNYDMARKGGTFSDVKVQCGNAAALLNGSFEQQGENFTLKARLRGTKMPVQDLTTILPAFGVTLPKGASLQGGVLNADLTTEGPVNRLVTIGKADISKTTLVGFDLAGKMAALATLAGIQPNQRTEIEKFSSVMKSTPDGIQVSDLLLIMPSLGELSGAGKIAPDQSLDFTMLAKLKPAGGIGATLTHLTKGGSLNIPFFVRGSASDPKFVPDVKNAARDLLGSAFGGQSSNAGQSGTGNALGDALRGFLKKKK